MGPSTISEVPLNCLCSLFFRALYRSTGVQEQYAKNTVNMNYIGMMRSVFKNTTKQKELETLSYVL